jgi:hypothetical protein
MRFAQLNTNADAHSISLCFESAPLRWLQA